MRSFRAQGVRKLSALFLAVLFIVQSVSLSTSGFDGTFVLCVITATDTVVEPVRIPYDNRQTIEQAIHAAGINLTYADGILQAVNGVYGAYSICTDDGGFDLSQSAANVTAVCIAERKTDLLTLLPLLRTMGVYLENNAHIQNYKPAQEAYNDALRALRSDDAAQTEIAQNNLQSALTAFDALISGTRYTVRIAAMQNGSAVEDTSAVWIDAYGNVTTADHLCAQLIAGEYSFRVSHGKNSVSGTATVQSDTTLTVHLPHGEWFGAVRLLDGDKNDYPAEYDAAGALWTVQIPDTAVERDVFLYASQGKDIPDPQSTRLYADYIGTDGTDYAGEARTWENSEVCLQCLLQKGMNGQSFTLTAAYSDADGLIARQTCSVLIERTPTIAALTVSADGVRLPLDFDPLQKDYTIAASADVLQIDAQGLGDSYSVQGCGAIPCAADTTHTVTVAAEGITTAYTLHIEKRTAASVTLAVPDGTSAVVQNKAGNTIMPQNGRYSLTEGESYTYLATRNSVYHTSAAFVASDGLCVTVALPDTNDALSALALYNTGSIRTRTAYLTQPAFSAAEHACSITVEDASATLYAQAASVDCSSSITALYNRQSTDKALHGTPYAKEITTQVQPDSSATFLNTCLMRGGCGQTVVFRVSRIENNVQYTQDYTVHIRRSVHLSALSATHNAQPLPLRDTEGTITAFTRSRTDYRLEVESSANRIALHLAFTSSDGGYSAFLNGQITETPDDTAIMLTEEPEQTATIEVRHADPDAIPTVYTLHIRLVSPVFVRFRTNPADACVFLTRKDTGDRILPAEKGFPLFPDAAYAYTVTSYGYIAQAAQFNAPQTDEEITITLLKTAQTDLPQLDETWRSGRSDAFNNGITDAKTPISAENAMLYWATKLGDGTGSDACGCPILVGDFLFTYAGSHVYKLDPVSGEILTSGEMDRRSGFAIQTPTYAEGMLFVALSDGAVQAFRADTLESLWIYRNERGGQPNSPIVYRNGYLYTGFWIDEMTNADFVCLSVTDEDPNAPLEEKFACWSYAHAGGFYWAGAYAGDDFVLVGTDDGDFGSTKGHAQILSFDPKTGLLLDSLTLPHPGDVRSSITYLPATASGTAYFTVRSGWFDALTVTAQGTFGALRTLRLENGAADSTPMSTSTPAVYNGRAYVGVSGASQFSAWSGHAVDVIDLNAWNVAYTVPTQGFPQTDGLLTTAYAEENGCVYVYFFDNYTPGKLRILCDRPGLTAPQMTTEENGRHGAYVLFTPTGAHAQYALCSPVADAFGTLYFKNDSGYVFALGSAVRELTVTRLPDKCSYSVGDVFDPTGMVVTAEYANGLKRDITAYVHCSTEPLSEDDSQFWITFPYALYSDAQGAGTQAAAPFAVLNLTITNPVAILGDTDGDGILTAADVQRIYAYLSGVVSLSAAQQQSADYNCDGMVNVDDARLLFSHLTHTK